MHQTKFEIFVIQTLQESFYVLFLQYKITQDLEEWKLPYGAQTLILSNCTKQAFIYIKYYRRLQKSNSNFDNENPQLPHGPNWDWCRFIVKANGDGRFAFGIQGGQGFGLENSRGLL